MIGAARKLKSKKSGDGTLPGQLVHIKKAVAILVKITD